MEDASPYIPAGDELASYLVGLNHSVVIGEKVIKIQYSDQMSERDRVLFANCSKENRISTRSSYNELEKDWDVNTFADRYDADGNQYKVSFEIKQMPQSLDHVSVYLGSQKKGAFAWRRPKNQIFYLKLELSNFQFLLKGPYGQDIWTTSPDLIYVYSADGGTITIEFGRFWDRNRLIEGKAYVWTEHTVEKGDGGVLFETVNGKRIPKCLNDKSHVCKISLANRR